MEEKGKAYYEMFNAIWQYLVSLTNVINYDIDDYMQYRIIYHTYMIGYNMSVNYFFLLKVERESSEIEANFQLHNLLYSGCCLLYTSPSPRDRTRSRMPSSA